MASSRLWPGATPATPAPASSRSKSRAGSMTASAVASCSAAEAWASKSASSSASRADIEGAASSSANPAAIAAAAIGASSSTRPAATTSSAAPTSAVASTASATTASGSGCGQAHVASLARVSLCRRGRHPGLVDRHALGGLDLRGVERVRGGIDLELRRDLVLDRVGDRGLGAERAREAILRQVGLRPQVRLEVVVGVRRRARWWRRAPAPSPRGRASREPRGPRSARRSGTGPR